MDYNVSYNCDYEELIDSAKENGLENAFITPAEGLKKINNGTLLIILDTHISTFIESKEIYEKCKKVIVIDHHRKMVNFINNALIFFHEPLEYRKDWNNYATIKKEKISSQPPGRN